MVKGILEDVVESAVKGSEIFWSKIDACILQNFIPLIIKAYFFYYYY